jgi:hypothetical protein
MRTWRDWMDSSRDERIAEGRARIAAVDDPNAAPALIRLLEREKVPWIYDELLATLGQLNHSATAQAMVDIALYSDDADTARRALDYLMRLNVPRSIVPFVGALGNKDNVIVNRAAEALGVLEDAEAISPLIDALQTKHKFQVNTGGQTSATFSNSGGGFTQGGGPKIVERLLSNVEVLQALSKLSGGLDFGYDERAWRNWYVNERSSSEIDARRDD